MPDNQGKGVGKAFVNAIADIARRNNNDKLLLNVNRYNKAILFYEAIGFTKLREEDIDIGNGYLMEDYIMLKNI
jgi:diamine N-acetyltransferase